MTTRFAASRVTTGGRKFFAQITEVEEQHKTFTDDETGEERPTTQLSFRFERPDGKYELEWYRIPEDENQQITTRSDLGKLINYFAKMGISDFGMNDYEPVRNLYVEVEVFPRKNRRTGADTDKRFPIRALKPDEIAQHFGGAKAKQATGITQQTDPTELFEAILPSLQGEGGIEGLPEKALFTQLASIATVSRHPQADVIFENAQTGKLTEWLKSNGHFHTDADGKFVAGEAVAEAAAAVEATPEP